MYIQNNCNTVYRRNVVFFMYIIVNTLHKGDNKDDDDDDDNNNNYRLQLEIIIIIIIICFNWK